jgi:hypothetical protein
MKIKTNVKIILGTLHTVKLIKFFSATSINEDESIMAYSYNLI